MPMMQRYFEVWRGDHRCANALTHTSLLAHIQLMLEADDLMPCGLSVRPAFVPVGEVPTDGILLVNPIAALLPENVK